jgi:low temperature requirement protein LtrA
MGMPAIRTRMRTRDTTEANRVSTPLELLFDLTFVAAISRVAVELALAIERGDALKNLPVFLFIFFAIWLAWLNFTWFASGYDTDDVIYRVMTLVQMAGVLVLAAGVQPAFEFGDYRAATLGYFIMRIALVGQWVRAAVQNPDSRKVALRYAGGILFAQALWIIRLAFPPDVQFALFPVLAVVELLVAPFAGDASWHPHHIAERYGLFTIILLGESVLASTIAVQQAIVHGVPPGLVVIAVSGLVIVFGIWWIYFSKEPGEGLENYRDRAFIWGYGHYGVFAALAALAAGLEAAVASVTGEHVPASHFGFGVAIPVAVFLVLLWVLNAPLHVTARVHPSAIVAAAVLTALVPLLPIGVPTMLALIALVVVLLLAVTLALESRTLKS